MPKSRISRSPHWLNPGRHLCAVHVAQHAQPFRRRRQQGIEFVDERMGMNCLDRVGRRTRAMRLAHQLAPLDRKQRPGVSQGRFVEASGIDMWRWR